LFSLLISAFESLLHLDVCSLQATKDQNLENSDASISTYLETHALASSGTVNLFQKWIELAKCGIGHLIRGSRRHEEVLFYGRQCGGFDIRLFPDFQFS
jgi:hypothetical protein